MAKHRRGSNKTTPAEATLGDLYYDFSRPSGFASVEKLRQAVPPGQKRAVLPWLRTQKLYTSTAPRRRSFLMNPYLPTGRNQTWEIDLIIMDNVRAWNGPYRYIMIVVDIFDKYCWAEPMKQKTARAAADAFSAILERAYPRVCTVLRSDSDGAFLGGAFSNLLKAKGIRLQPAGGIVKASQVERLIRTIKSKLFKIFYFRGVFKYTDILQQVIDTYNHTRHSSTNFAPAEVTENEVYDIWFRNYLQHAQKQPPRPRFKVGDYVRLLIARDTLADRGFYQAYTNEIFRIYRVQTKHATGYLPRPIYHLKDLSGEPIKTASYGEELSLVSFDPNEKGQRVEKVVSYRSVGRSKKVEYEVKFRGSNETKFVSEEQLRQLM